MTLQTAKPGRFQIRDDDNLPANELFRRVVISNAGANLPVFAAKVDLKHHEFVRIGMRLGAFDRCHFEFDLSKGVYRNHPASSLDLGGRIAEHHNQKKKDRISNPAMREIRRMRHFESHGRTDLINDEKTIRLVLNCLTVNKRFTIGNRYPLKGGFLWAKSLAGTKSHQNLKEAFAGESQANRRYLYFARVADIEGYPDVGGLFRDTSEAETGHAFGHLDFLKEVGDPCTGVPIGTTEKNLKSAVEGETYEYTEMYPGFAKTAREEGLSELAEWFETLAKAEKSHAGRFNKGLDGLGQLT